MVSYFIFILLSICGELDIFHCSLLVRVLKDRN